MYKYTVDRKYTVAIFTKKRYRTAIKRYRTASKRYFFPLFPIEITKDLKICQKIIVNYFILSF